MNPGHTRTFNPVLHKALELGLSLKDIDFLFAVYDEFLLADSIPQLFDVKFQILILLCKNQSDYFICTKF